MSISMFSRLTTVEFPVSVTGREMGREAVVEDVGLAFPAAASAIKEVTLV